MASQLSLFKRRHFSAMFFTQFLGAFNDNIFKQALILILTYTAVTKMGMKISQLNNLAALLFILPYFLFSALAGQIADKYEKSMLTQSIKLLEIIIMAIAAIGFWFELYWLLFLALFLMGTQSTFFGPVKYAYLSEVMHKNELVGANGLFQTGTSLAILIGMIVAGLLTQLNHANIWLIGVTLIVAILGYISAKFLPYTPARATDLAINWNIFSTSFSLIKYLYSLPLLFFVIIGNSWFWFYGATFLTQMPELSKMILHSDESVVILLLILFSVGVSLGSLLCKTLTKNQVSLKLLPFGMIGLSLFAIDLYFSLSAINISSGSIHDISSIFGVQGAWRVFADLFCLGFFGGVYIVPMYAFMQAYAPISHRSRIVGTNNIFNAIFMVGSAIFSIIMLSQLGLSLPMLFFVSGILNALFGIFLYRKLMKYRHTMVMNDDNTSTL
ncbi:MFS transporter [Moraxella sp. ZY200743]|uniref:MFS transporter n=1 Tax=Moraxella sp. ZY200743 TaxID=2911970 RepID=UPI003D7D082F